jgi:lipopolysaccharide transport system ATP-binding protein
MSNIAIQVEHLSKMYRLGVINNGTLWQDIQTFFALKFGKEDPNSKIGEDKYSGDKDHFWALKNISLEIKQGDRLGIIGKNGAGKSTLLKILSRITTPTEGTIKIKGKVASLLEVGTGFHGELTGRENIYLNGAILGMRKRRIDEKIDEIIAFSGIEQHIDTPVKRYSSGMYVRLAFAVAAHLDSDILIADEVLAVGDAEFQKKALGKMQDLSTGEGRTVLFVSHNMGAVKHLCNCGILLDKGELKFNCGIQEIIEKYIIEQELRSQESLSEIKERVGNGALRFTKIEFIDNDNNIRDTFKTGEDLIIKLFFDYTATMENCITSQIDIGINDSLNTRVSWLSSSIYTDKFDFKKKYICFKVKRLLLMEGTYNLNLYCSTNLGIADYVINVCKLKIIFDDFWETGRKTSPDNQGYLVTDFKLEYS